MFYRWCFGGFVAMEVDLSPEGFAWLCLLGWTFELLSAWMSASVQL